MDQHDYRECYGCVHGARGTVSLILICCMPVYPAAAPFCDNSFYSRLARDNRYGGYHVCANGFLTSHLDRRCRQNWPIFECAVAQAFIDCGSGISWASAFLLTASSLNPCQIATEGFPRPSFQWAPRQTQMQSLIKNRQQAVGEGVIEVEGGADLLS